MTQTAYRWPVLLAVLLGFAPPVWSQVSPPHIGYVYPAGGQQGTTFEVKLGGQYLDAATSVQISGTGVEATVVRQTKPLTPREINALREKVMELQKKPKKSPAEQKEIAEIREKLAIAAIPINPGLAENVFIAVTIARSAPPGPRELRLGAKTGMSNPIVFDVGQLPEMRQKKESFDPEDRPRRPLARFAKRKEIVKETEIKVTLPAVFNSQILPGEVDRYRFPARKGQHLVFRARARALIPYLADAVPGWFQASLTLYDDSGTEVAFNDDYRHQPDPVLAYKVPRDGEYVLEMHDALYRGREDFVYRIEAGELPHITSIFPLGGQAKVRSTLALEGWNLPVSSLTLEPGDMKPGIIPVSIAGKDMQSNQVPFRVNTLPDCLEQEPNNSIAQAHKLTWPIIVNGQISKPGDWDVFRFQGRVKETIVAEVWARRLDSPLDSVLKLTDDKGKVLAFNDDHVDRSQGLQTHHADSLLRATLPADGTYYLHVADVRRHGSSAHAYRLRLSSPQPDFELRVTPCSINARPGSTVPITVYALRKDGFKQDINLSLKYTPLDFTLGGAKIPANQDEVRLTLQVPSTPRKKPVQIHVEGRATINGNPVSRVATPAEDMMQAFAYHHLVPANHLLVTVSGGARARFPARLLESGPVKIRPGGTAVARIAIPRGVAADHIQLILSDPPEGITLTSTSFSSGGAVLQFFADAEKVKPGLRTNLIVEAYPDVGKKGKPSRFALGTLPAIPVEVIRPNR
jgi:hypothetical protein